MIVFIVFIDSYRHNIHRKVKHRLHRLISQTQMSVFQVLAASSAGTGASKWVSRWASLADGYSESGPTAALSQEDLSSAGESH